MRKLLFSVLFFCVLTSCEKPEKSDFPALGKSELTDVIIFSEGITERVGYTEALAVAQRGIQMLENDTQTRSTAGRRIDPTALKGLVASSTRGGSESDTLMYVFNFANDRGFAIVSTFREEDPLLAVTESGSYTPGEPTGNSSLDWYLASLETSLQSYSKVLRPIDPGPPGTYPSKIEAYEEVATIGPLVAVSWGQASPYGELCPNKRSGCVATAMAQIMSVYSYPNTISLTYPGANRSSINLDWANMNKFLNVFGWYDVPADTGTQIAYLMREIGQQVGMDYKQATNERGPLSGASSKNVPGGFNHFGYTCSNLLDYAYSSIYRNLQSHKPIYMRGVDSTNGGHAWVVDGDKTITRTIKTYRGRTSTGPWILESTETKVYSYLHCNWGWDGISNGYFRAGTFNTISAYEWDNSLPRESCNFNNSLKMITNISIK